MLPRLLFLAALAILCGAFVDQRWATWAAALAIALLPGALFALAERGRWAGWMIALTVSLILGMVLLLHPLPGWSAGMPHATLTVWLFLGVIPFGLTIYGTVVRRSPEDPS